MCKTRIDGVLAGDWDQSQILRMFQPAVDLAADLDRRLADKSGRETTLNWDKVKQRILGDNMHGP